jgi:hypothetical protein
MPQTAFYSINNDILSPLLGATLLLAFLIYNDAEVPNPRQGFWLGLAFAGTFLTKISNLPILAVAGAFVLWKIFELNRAGKLTAAAPSLAVLAATALLPIAGWMTWCKMNFGDFTGSILKIQFLNWTNKPFAQWFHHPMFTIKGFWYFISGNLSSLWQGEYLWHGRPLAFHDLNRFYVVFTLLMLLIVLIALNLPRVNFTRQQRLTAIYGFACVVASFAFFAVLSVKYDFHDCYYPSTAHPFFLSGRLMLGMLLPFLILIAIGLDRLTGSARDGFKFAVLVLVLIFMVAGEVSVDWNIFPNAYNWYHM